MAVTISYRTVPLNNKSTSVAIKTTITLLIFSASLISMKNAVCVKTGFQSQVSIKIGKIGSTQGFSTSGYSNKLLVVPPMALTEAQVVVLFLFLFNHAFREAKPVSTVLNNSNI